MKKLLLLLILFLQCFCLFPARTVKVTPILTLPQLPVSAIHRIFQDSQGYMWYGTVNGLCQDDGYRLRIFRSDINAGKIMENNIIQSIAEDAKGRIWFGCDQGAYILNKQDGRITPLDPERLGSCIYKPYPTYLRRNDVDYRRQFFNPVQLGGLIPKKLSSL